MVVKTKAPASSLKELQLLFLITSISLLHWLILALRIPVLDALPYWKFTLRETPAHWGWICISLLAMLLAVLITFSKATAARKLLSLILLGVSMQFSFAFSKGMGIDGIRDRIINSGHAEFANVAIKQPGILYTAQNYDALASKKQYGFIPSKPPGTLIFYMITEKVANLGGTNYTPERLENLRTFASVTWPFISYLVIITLFYLARILYDESVATTACLFYLPIPSINLITLHTDQVIYPILALIPILLITLAVQKRSIWLACLSGIAIYIAIYFSFGLAVMGVFFTLPFLVHIELSFNRLLVLSTRLLGSAVLAFVTCDLLARKFLNYDIIFRYSRAIKHHADWTIWENSASTFLYSGFTNLVEFMAFLGVPLSILLILAMINAFRQLIIGRDLNASSILPALLFGAYCFLLAFGKIKAETARLWIFFIPLVCLISAGFLENKPWQQEHKNRFAAGLMVFEFITTYLILRHQDFS